MKSCLKPVVDFESNSKSVKSYKWFHTQKKNLKKKIKKIKVFDDSNVQLKNKNFWWFKCSVKKKIFFDNSNV